MTATKTKQVREPDKKSITTQSKSADQRRVRLDKEVNYFNANYPIDFQTVRSLERYLTEDEAHRLRLRCGQKAFTPALLRALGKANKRRDERLGKLLDAILPELLADIPSPVSDAISQRVHARIDRYDGEAKFEPVLEWVESEAAFHIIASRAIREDAVQSVKEFMAIYREGRDALLGGIRKGLMSALDLGADMGDEKYPGDTGELEQRAWIRIWQNLPAWTTPGTASITTRLYAYGLDQAHGWKTERLRERERFVRGMFDERRDVDEDEREAA